MPELYNVYTNSSVQSTKTLLSFSTPDFKKLLYERAAGEVMNKRRVDRRLRNEPSRILFPFAKFPSSLIVLIKCCLAFSIFFASTPCLAKVLGQTITFSGK